MQLPASSFCCVLLLALIEAKCPTGTFPGAGEFDCYRMASTKATFEDAVNECTSSNGHLPSAPSAVVNSLLAKKAPAGGIWLGASEISKRSREIRWLDGTVSDFSNWAKDEPTAHENTIVLQPNGQWKSADANTKKSFICQVGVTLDLPPVADGTDASPKRCQDGWTYLNSSHTCVNVHKDVISWMDALSRCRREGADLVKITDETVNYQLKDLLGDDTQRHYAIGVYAPTATGHDDIPEWTFTDGSKLAYHHAFIGGQWSWLGRCVYAQLRFMKNATRKSAKLIWLVEPCVKRGGFVCEMPAFTTTSSGKKRPQGVVSRFFNKARAAVQRAFFQIGHMQKPFA